MQLIRDMEGKLPRGSDGSHGAKQQPTSEMLMN